MISIPLSFSAGETFSPLPFLWQDSCGNPINMTGFTASFVAKLGIGMPDPPFILAQTNPPGNGFETINPRAGSIQLILPAGYTSGLIVPPMEVWTGFWEQWVYSSTGVAYKLYGGALQVYGSLL